MYTPPGPTARWSTLPLVPGTRRSCSTMTVGQVTRLRATSRSPWAPDFQARVRPDSGVTAGFGVSAVATRPRIGWSSSTCTRQASSRATGRLIATVLPPRALLILGHRRCAGDADVERRGALTARHAGRSLDLGVPPRLGATRQDDAAG